MSIRVIITAKDAILRGQLRARLETQRDMDVIGEFAEAAMACEFAGSRPDIICVTEKSATARLTQQLLTKYPEARVIQLFATLDSRPMEEALQAGVTGYLLHSSALEEIIRAIHAVMAGRYYSSPEITSWMAGSYKKLINRRGSKQGIATLPQTPPPSLKHGSRA